MSAITHILAPSIASGDRLKKFAELLNLPKSCSDHPLTILQQSNSNFNNQLAADFAKKKNRTYGG
jgi:hypothetical protein